MVMEAEPMPSSDATPAVEGRVFRATYTWPMHIALCLFAAGLIGGCWLIATVDVPVDAGVVMPDSPWMVALGWGPGVMTLVLAAPFFALRAQRERVVVDNTRAVITDWRRRERTVRWQDVERVRLFGWRGLPRHSWIELRTRTAAGTSHLYVPDLITERDALLAEAIARANLHKARAGWLEVVYERPSLSPVRPATTTTGRARSPTWAGAERQWPLSGRPSGWTRSAVWRRAPIATSSPSRARPRSRHWWEQTARDAVRDERLGVSLGSGSPVTSLARSTYDRAVEGGSKVGPPNAGDAGGEPCAADLANASWSGVTWGEAEWSGGLTCSGG
jgi:hypothetical protein